MMQTSRQRRHVKNRLHTVISATIRTGILGVTINVAPFSVGALAAEPAATSQTASSQATSSQETSDQTTRYEIPAGALSTTLIRFAGQAGILLSADARLAQGKSSLGLTGQYSVSQALETLLQGSGLSWHYSDANTITLQEVGAVAPVALDTLVIEATRQNLSRKQIPRAVTVIDREALKIHQATSQNLAELLSKTVPGMAPSSQTNTIYSQTLRGRNMLVLIDGVPQNTNRNASRQLMTIDPANIERIEVVRGSSAVFGAGASGGIVNIITRRGSSGHETTIGLGSSLTQLEQDALGGKIEHDFGGQSGKLDYGFNIAAQRTQGLYDANGRRIAPDPSQGDLSDSDNYNVGGRFGYGDDSNKLSLSFNHYQSEQDTDYISDPIVNNEPAGSVSAIAKKGLQLDEQTQSRNSQVSLNWQVENTVIGAVNSQLYYRDYETRFSPFDGRPYGGWAHLAQSRVESDTTGGRATVATPVSDLSRIRWGVDYNRENTEMPVTTYDGDTYDQSGGLIFVDTGDKNFMPPTLHTSIGTFAQFETAIGEDWQWEVGTRYERVTAKFDDYTTLGQQNDIKGGKVDYDDLLWNTGIVYFLDDAAELYANFSQGFELPDIGLQTRYAQSDFNIESSQLEPIKTDNYEVGFRGDWYSMQGTLALFYGRSDLGRVVTENFSLTQSREKERIYGIEFTLDYQPSSQWGTGTQITWMKGEKYNSSDNAYEALNGYRIPPLQAMIYAEYKPVHNWYNRLQANYSGSRDDAFEDGVGFGGREVHSYTTMDLVSRYQTEQGTFTIGIENLLNHDYYTVYGQLLRNGKNSSHVPALGATLKVSYAHRW